MQTAEATRASRFATWSSRPSLNSIVLGGVSATSPLTGGDLVVYAAGRKNSAQLHLGVGVLLPSGLVPERLRLLLLLLSSGHVPQGESEDAPWKHSGDLVSC